MSLDVGAERPAVTLPDDFSCLEGIGIYRSDGVDTRPSIFINIASYRDSECQWTVRDLFEKAEHPDRIFVGICWQFDPEFDQDCFQVEDRPDQVRKVEFHAKESRGVCWARHQVQKLWNGEEFSLQIDSHMRFVSGWDEILLEMYHSCPTARAVLSTYPVAYVPPDKLAAPAIVTILPREFDSLGLLKFKSSTQAPEHAPPRPTPTPYIAAGFLFGPATMIEEVPYDPYIYFDGEEITLAARLWTHGWDLFTPNRHLIYHDYTNRREKLRHWTDDKDWAVLNRLSVQRVRFLLAMDDARDADALTEIEKFGLGTVRALSEFEVFSGIEFKNRKIAGAPTPKTPSPDPDGGSAGREKVFTDIWKQAVWGTPETISGDGATLGRTEVIRQRLPEIFTELEISVLADAGCGDLNWIAHITQDLRLYLGFEIVGELLDELRVAHAARKSHFFSRTDIVVETLPACDAILCRDCLTHLSWVEAKEALVRLKQSGSTFLIATTHVGRENVTINRGGWYPMNLEAHPFDLPAPIMVIDEKLVNSTKALGVWRLADLKT